MLCKGSDTLESFLSKVAFENSLRKKLSRVEHVLIVKVYFERRKTAKVFMTHVQDFFQMSLSKATFERKLSSVSLLLESIRLSPPVRRVSQVVCVKCIYAATQSTDVNQTAEIYFLRARGVEQFALLNTVNSPIISK